MTLAQDQQLKDLVIKLNPQAVIVGRVVDEDGDPVPNVNVQALRYMYRQGVKQWVPAGNGQSSDIGEFRIPALQPGRYLVSAGGRGFGGDFNPFASNQPLSDKPETSYTTTYYPNSTDTSTAASVDVGAAAEMRGIEIHLQKIKVFRVRGKVANAPAGGRGNTMVFLMPRESETAGLVMRRYNGVARPPDGVFEIRGVPPGSYTLYAQANGQGQRLIAAQPLDIGSSHVDGVSLTLGFGNDVQGTVKVVDSAAPVDLANVNVLLRPAPGAAMGGPSRAKVADGRFTLKGVPPARFAVTVTGLPENCYVKSIQYGGREIGQNETVEMGGGGPLEVTISANAAALDVAVIDKDGRPAQGATLFLIGKNGTPSFTRGGAPDNGIVSFKGLAPGEYRVFAWEDVEQGAPQDPEFRKQFESKSEAIKIEPGAAAKAQVKAIPVDDMPNSR